MGPLFYPSMKINETHTHWCAEVKYRGYEYSIQLVKDGVTQEKAEEIFKDNLHVIVTMYQNSIEELNHTDRNDCYMKMGLIKKREPFTINPAEYGKVVQTVEALVTTLTILWFGLQYANQG